jgi:opacity protein-like surface antigen
MVRKVILSGVLFATSFSIQAQEAAKEKAAGKFSLGTRTTLSLFNGGDNNSSGLGLGGQFRIQFSNKVNSEWFADFITSDVAGVASRNDYHIGWSLMFYPGSKNDFTNFIQPYILAGHCFDYTRVEADNDSKNFKDRLSMAMQAGAGMHFNVTPLFDFSLSTQYMLHLGKEIKTAVVDDQVLITRSSSSKPDGHLLVTLSINYKIGNLW